LCELRNVLDMSELFSADPLHRGHALALVFVIYSSSAVVGIVGLSRGQQLK